jgi:transposase
MNDGRGNRRHNAAGSKAKGATVMGRYSRQFKAEAIKLVTEQGYGPAEAARKLGIPDTTYGTWVENSGWVKPQSKLSEDPKLLQVQLREAQARLKELEIENAILKKATAYFARQSL